MKTVFIIVLVTLLNLFSVSTAGLTYQLTEFYSDQTAGMGSVDDEAGINGSDEPDTGLNGPDEAEDGLNVSDEEIPEDEEPGIIDYTTVDLIDSPSASYDNVFEIEYTEEVSESISSTVEECLSVIPPVILENVADNGFKYIVDPSGTTTKKHAGMTIYPDCVIDGENLHLKDNLTPPDGKIAIMGDSVSRTKMAAVHEVGHAVDFIIGAAYGYSTEFENEPYMSMEGDPEWQKIFAEENEISDFPDYNRTCPLEYFAEVFRYVFEDPSKLDNIPRSREYVINLLEGFYGIEIQ